MKKLLVIIILILPTFSWANDIKVKDVVFNKANAAVAFTVSWKSSWKNNRNNDAAWVFVKFVTPNTSYLHGNLDSQGHTGQSISSGGKAIIILPSDRIGVFIQPSQPHRGDFEIKTVLKIDCATMNSLPSNVKAEVYAIEMVYIPKGGFTLGDPYPAAINFASFYKSDDAGQPNGLYKIIAENQEIQVGSKAGNLYYQTGRSTYRGDRKGLVPSSFPKGFDAFYMMKYETTQGVYTDFLNTISFDLAKSLSPHEVEDYYAKRGSIKVENEVFIAKSRNRPINYITWDDGAALADWAGLRPMTELEYTKASRGPSEPISHEFPWGTDNTEGLARKVELTDELVLINGMHESNMNEKNRHIYGASYFWVMDLAGSLWEKCVTIGDPIGRNYLGSHGDGVLSNTASATNSDWPKGIAEEGGYGYRGGGYYNHGMKVSEFNPHSPIAYRPYGSWAGGKRSIAYSQRYVRTAPKR
jgi:formylglycine-generating enzyme required for sulfatase activity